MHQKKMKASEWKNIRTKMELQRGTNKEMWDNFTIKINMRIPNFNLLNKTKIYQSILI